MMQVRQRSAAAKLDESDVEKAESSPSSSTDFSRPLLRARTWLKKQPKTGKTSLSSKTYYTRAIILLVVLVVYISIGQRTSGDALLIRVNALLTFLENHGYMDAIYGFDYNYYSKYPQLKTLDENYPIIKQELMNILKLSRDNIPRTAKTISLTSRSMQVEWKSIFLKMGKMIPENAALAPKTAEWLAQMPNVYTAFFSIIEPHTYLAAHWGHWKGFVRYQLALVVPENNDVDKKCWIRVVPRNNRSDKQFKLFQNKDYSLMDEQGVKHFYKEGQGVMFDDVFAHDSNNSADTVRIVLFLDIARNMPWPMRMVHNIFLFIAMRTPHVKGIQKRAPLNIVAAQS